MKLLIIGGTGFLGRRMLYELAYDEEIEIVALARAEVPPDLRLKNVEWVAVDAAHVERYAHRFADFDLVLHMGGIRNPAAPCGRDGFMAANVEALDRLLREVRRRAVKLFVHVTDVCALGDTGNVTGDEERRRPPGFGSDFEESLSRGLDLVEALRPDVKTIIALVGPTFGRGDPGFLQPILERAAAGDVKTLVGAGHFCSPLHVDDLKAGILKLLVKGDANRRYILCGEPIELQNLVHMAASIAGRRISPRRCDGMTGRLHAAIFGRLGLSPFTPPLAAYLCGASYAYESHRAKKELRWSHGLLRDRLAATLKDAGLA